jgi:hypothetical protein
VHVISINVFGFHNSYKGIKYFWTSARWWRELLGSGAMGPMTPLVGILGQGFPVQVYEYTDIAVFFLHLRFVITVKVMKGYFVENLPTHTTEDLNLQTVQFIFTPAV